jgi:S-formylglutathione hydrolase FrmB
MSDKSKSNITIQELVSAIETMAPVEFRKLIQGMPETNIWKSLVLTAVKDHSPNAITLAGSNAQKTSNSEKNWMMLMNLVEQYYADEKHPNEFVKQGLEKSAFFKSDIVNVDKKVADKPYVLSLALINQGRD